MPVLLTDVITFFKLLKESYEQQSDNVYKLFVRKWSDVDCFYEQVVRALGSRFAYDVIYKEQAITSAATRQAISDIVSLTCLKDLIEYDKETGKMPWKASVSDRIKSEIGKIMINSTSPVMPSYDMHEIRKEIGE